jgi:hypothetical protein
MDSPSKNCSTARWSAANEKIAGAQKRKPTTQWRSASAVTDTQTDSRATMSDLVSYNHATEGGHWYSEDARQINEVPGSKGTPVKPDIRHARKFDLGPGVTTICKQLDKPALTRWMCEQAIMSALTLPRNEGELEAEWLRRVDVDRQERSRQTAEEGTRIHAAIQAYVQGETVSSDYGAHINGFVRMMQNVGIPLEGMQAELCVVKKGANGGYGTKLDLVGNGWLLDFKSKDGDEAALLKLAVYDEYAMQLAGGAQAYDLSLRQGIVFLSRTHPGVCVLAESKKKARALAMFNKLLSLWKIRNDDYCPSWGRNEDAF